MRRPARHAPFRNPSKAAFMPTLYHHSMSSASRFVRLILAEYGFQTELAEEQPWENRRDFLASRLRVSRRVRLGLRVRDFARGRHGWRRLDLRGNL